MEKKNDINSDNDQCQILQQIVEQWKQIMSTLPNRGRGEVLANCSKALFSEDEPDTLFVSLEKNWYRSLSGDRKLIQSISDAIANKYGVQLQIRLIDSILEERESLTTIPPKPKRTKVIECELCGGDSFRKEGGFFICEQCGCKYPKEEAKKLIRI